MIGRLVVLPLVALGLMAVAGAHAPQPVSGTASAPPDHLAWPLREEWVLTQPYGCTDFLLEPVASWCSSGHFHAGIDMAAPAGTGVYAAAPGVARVAENPAGYGLYVIVEHGGAVATLYGHLQSTPLSGERAVAAGEEVGRIGSSGLSTGPHLHFEVRRQGRPVDPVPWLPAV